MNGANVQRFCRAACTARRGNIYIIFLATDPPLEKHWLCLKGCTNESGIGIQRAATHVSYRESPLGVCSDTYTLAWQQIMLACRQIGFLINESKKTAAAS